jgi:hypothetical protein
METNTLIQKEYLIFPFPFEQCIDFKVFLKTEPLPVTQILSNLLKEDM